MPSHKKGDWLLGVQIFPQGGKGGYFITDRLSAGTSLIGSFSHGFGPQVTNINATVAPFLRYYFAPKGGMQAGKFYAFADAQFQYAMGWNNNTLLKSQQYSDAIGAGVAPGLIYLVNDRVSGEAALRFNYLGLDAPGSDGISTTFEIGFNVFLKCKKKRATDASEMRSTEL